MPEKISLLMNLTAWVLSLSLSCRLTRHFVSELIHICMAYLVFSNRVKPVGRAGIQLQQVSDCTVRKAGFAVKGAHPF